jgi:uracil-DNA glycosylase
LYIDNDWQEILKKEFSKEYFKDLVGFLKYAYDNRTIYPDREDIFNAFNLSSYQDTKVVILGQDPYHQYHQAHGLAFSVPDGVKIPPSLNNINKEIQNDLGISMSKNGNLTKWAQQGVLLLNTILTVEEGKPNSHKEIGWEIFTDRVIKKLSEKDDEIIFILWGNGAKLKSKFISDRHYKLTAAHPSPLSAYRGFFGCKHFSKANEILKSLNKKEIDWKI